MTTATLISGKEGAKIMSEGKENFQDSAGFSNFSHSRVSVQHSMRNENFKIRIMSNFLVNVLLEGQTCQNVNCELCT